MYQNIRISDIQIDNGFNVRSILGDLSGLAESIRTLGIQQPLGVTRDDNGVYGLMYGFRRIHAAIEAGVTEVPCRVYESINQNDQFLLNLQENVSRESLNPMDEARGVRRLLDSGMHIDQITSSLGFSKTLITQRLQLLEYSISVQNALSEQRISVAQARAVSQLPPERQERFIDIAAELPITKLREMVEAELVKIEKQNNPELEVTPELVDDKEDGPSNDKADPTMLITGIISMLNDIAAAAFGEDGSKSAKALVTFKSIDWTGIAFSDLEAFNDVLSEIVDASGVEGASDN